jgi:hypothetical protein
LAIQEEIYPSKITEIDLNTLLGMENALSSMNVSVRNGLVSLREIFTRPVSRSGLIGKTGKALKNKCIPNFYEAINT